MSEEYVCPECGKKFDREISLRMHMIRKHRTAKLPEKK